MAKARVVARHVSPEKRDIAIIGMSGRFPGASTVEELWQNLLAKKNSISKWSVDEIDPSVPAELRNDPDYVKARGVISDADKFDAAFFGVNPRVAALMDPQQRLFLLEAWRALEHAGCNPRDLGGLRAGVFAGCSYGDYEAVLRAAGRDGEAFAFDVKNLGFAYPEGMEGGYLKEIAGSYIFQANATSGVGHSDSQLSYHVWRGNTFIDNNRASGKLQNWTAIVS
jgi:acyl transferase domain-containing protein